MRSRVSVVLERYNIFVGECVIGAIKLNIVVANKIPTEHYRLTRIEYL